MFRDKRIPPSSTIRGETRQGGSVLDGRFSETTHCSALQFSPFIQSDPNALCASFLT